MKIKRILALFTAAILLSGVLLVSAGCTPKADASYIITANGEKYPVEPYLFYLRWMHDYYYAFAQEVADANKQSVNWTKVLASTDLTAPLTLSEYLVSSAKSSYLTYVVVNKVFRELGLSLTQEQWDEVDQIIQKDWVMVYGQDGFNSLRNELHMSWEEFRDLMAVQKKSDAIIQYYYGTGGELEISEEEMKDYFEEKYARFKYIVLMTKDDKDKDLSEEELAQKKETRDTVLARLEEGAAFEDLIREYSEDYVRDTSDLTTAEKESAEKQNTMVTEDGLVTNTDGVFDSALATYYSIKVDTDVVDKVFTIKEGEYTTVEIDDSIWIVKRYSTGEKEEYFESAREDCFSALYASDLNTKFTKWTAELNYAYNDAALTTYAPENLTVLFRFQ